MIKDIMIEFKGVSKYFLEQSVLKDFSYTINEGMKVCITGRSGAGKSTLFNLILGFETPDEGSVYYKNKLLDGKMIWNVRKEIAYVSQDLNIGHGSVQELFDETANFRNNMIHREEYTKEIPDLLEKFNLDISIINKKIETLSGGEKQRIAIINAILLKRKFYLLDECTSALDISLKEKVMNYFLFQPELTVLYISHDNTNYKGVAKINFK